MNKEKLRIEFNYSDKLFLWKCFRMVMYAILGWKDDAQKASDSAFQSLVEAREDE